MAHPPVQYRDRALRRLSFVSKGLAFGAILGTGGIAAAIAHATPAQPTTASTPPASADKATNQGAARGNAPAPASRGRPRIPAGQPANTGASQRAVPNRAPSTQLAPPPAPPTAAATTADPPPQPAPTTSGGS
jgi:hypothetical protein